MESGNEGKIERSKMMAGWIKDCIGKLKPNRKPRKKSTPAKERKE